MGKKVSGGELFIVDNNDKNWKVLNYLHDWCGLSETIDIATGYFEIGSLLALNDEWQKVDKIRILMGDEVSARTRNAFQQALEGVKKRLDQSIEDEKEKHDFLTGLPAIVDALRTKKIACRVYRKDKFHAKAFITHARQQVLGAFALVGSSNLTYPGLTQNVELNVQITGRQVTSLQDWYEKHWKAAEEVTLELLKTIERHTRDYSPFEIYARSLQEYFRSHELTADEWEQQESKIYPILATYQRNGYHGMMKRAKKYNGAFLCDGVGLGKTYIGLMLIERLVQKEKKRVVLFVPKSARQPVWEAKIRKYLPEILHGFISFRIYNHTDLFRKKGRIRQELEQMKRQADVVIIDEAHHFRNTGTRVKEGEDRINQYWEMFEICEGKQVYMLTATPVNNRLTDFQHMTELISRREPNYFDMAPLGIHSLPGHIRKLEKEIEEAAQKREQELAGNAVEDVEEIQTNLLEAEDVLRDDALFEELVVQRSRSYVKQSLKQEDAQVLFPQPTPPKVVPYSVKQTYGKLLKLVEEAFNKKKPLFSLAMYYPYEYYTGDKDLKQQELAMVAGRQKQIVQLIRTAFLKRFESSVYAFEASCRTLLKKLIAFYHAHAEDKHDKENLMRWLARNKDVTGYDPEKQGTLFPEEIDVELPEEDVIEQEFFEEAFENGLNPEEFNISGLLRETANDLDQIAVFLRELAQFEPKQDKKLQALIQLLRGHKSGLKDVVLQRHKVLIFSEFKDTARYIAEQLEEAGFENLVEIDSDVSSDNRLDIITAFSPYYNDSSSRELARGKLQETRILISTDVLSEGLNLQDATRLINYDLHWNPVRLMQRIGRIDRRLDPQVEQQMIEDHPELENVRGKIQYYNFLPPDELNELLSLYKKVTHKTLRISKTFGIENGKLLREDDDYDILRDFVQQCEGATTQTESLSLEYQKLLAEYPDLQKKLSTMPNRIFSGKESPSPDAKGVFFCYARPARDVDSDEWTLEAGDVKWYFYDLNTEQITDDPHAIADLIRSQPDTQRTCEYEMETLKEIRKKLDRHIKSNYFRSVNAPMNTKATLRAWMEIN